MGFITC